MLSCDKYLVYVKANKQAIHLQDTARILLTPSVFGGEGLSTRVSVDTLFQHGVQNPDSFGTYSPEVRPWSWELS